MAPERKGILLVSENIHYAYEIVRSDRKTMAIQIKNDGRVIVRAPLRMPDEMIQDFVETKKGWIGKHIAAIRQRMQTAPRAYTPEELKRMMAEARQDIPHRVERYAAILGVSWGKITIRAQKTRWGSCSAKGNLNFNGLLMLCPEEVRDYVVVHELCHRKELNHSARFWGAVKAVYPEYERPRKWLREHGSGMIQRLREVQ